MSPITKLQIWLLRRICRALVRQGPLHARNIEAYYQIMQEAAHREFSEDNWHTLNHFLTECHQKAAMSTFPVPEGDVMLTNEKGEDELIRLLRAATKEPQ
jgi:hypothetical protein